MRTWIALSVLVLLPLAACGSPLPGDDPRTVVQAYHDACGEGDFGRALSLTTESYRQEERISRSDAIDALRNDHSFLVGEGANAEILRSGGEGEERWVEVRLSKGHLRLYALDREPEGWRISWWLDGTSPAWSEPRVRLPWAMMSVEDKRDHSPELVLSLDAELQVSIEGTRLGPEASADRLRAYAIEKRQAGTAHLLLRVDRSVAWSEVSRLFAQAAEAGLHAVSAGAASETDRGRPTSAQTEGSLFRSLEMRIACFLPREPVAPEEVGLVLDVGARGFDEFAADAALEALKGRWPDPAKLTVVVNARPAALWQDVIRAVDLSCRLGAWEGVVLAAPGEEPPETGLRVNGLRIEEAAEAAALPSPRDHPAIARILHL